MKKSLIRLISVILMFTLATSVFVTVYAEEDMVFKCADVNGDGKINAADALDILKYTAKLIETFSVEDTDLEDVWDIGDVTGNNEVNSKDALEILKYAAGIITEFPIAERYPNMSVEDLRNTLLGNIENEIVLGEYKGIEVEAEPINVDDYVQEYIDMLLELTGEDELTDELVASLELEDGITTVEAFEKALREYMETVVDEVEEYYNLEAILKQIVDGCILLDEDVSAEIEAYYEEMVAIMKEGADMEGITYEEYVTTYLEMSVEEFENEIKAEYEAYLVGNLAMKAIAKAEDITVSQAVFNAAYAEMYEGYGSMGYESAEEYAEVIYEEVLLEQVYEFMKENATIVYK